MIDIIHIIANSLYKFPYKKGSCVIIVKKPLIGMLLVKYFMEVLS